MKICDACGKENQDHYRFCLGCGGDLGSARVSVATPVAPEPRRPSAGQLAVRVFVQCSHCALPVPVNGPLMRVRCDACSRETEILDLADALRDAIVGVHRVGSRVNVTRLADPAPQCHACGAEVSIASWLAPPHPAIVCGRCGSGVSTAWAPDWLRARVPELQWIVGGDRELDAPPDAVGLTLGQKEPRPIAMACPQCSAGLTVTARDDRTIDCRFCGVAVFLPDELWRRLHPVTTMRTWTLTWFRP